MYVYCTNSFEDELKKYRDLSLRVQNLCSKLQASNFVVAQERFERIHSYLKRKEGNFRLIAKIIRLDREPILCFLKLYNRGEPEYKHFLERVKHQSNLFQELLLVEVINCWLLEQKKSQDRVIRPTIADDLRIWLQRPDWQIKDQEIVIHESDFWSHQFNQPEIRNQALVYRQLIEELINQISNNFFRSISTKWKNISVYGYENFYLLYSNFVVQEHSHEQVLLLIAPIIGVVNDVIIDRTIEALLNQNLNKKNLIKLLQSSNLYLDDLITYTKRSYPWYLICDEKFWLKIQDTNEINLALSTEEKDLLHSVSTNTSLPLFLNGRAGSGKSTMLFYLFADYCYRHLKLCYQKNINFLAKPHPLFITYSPNLSDLAKAKVQSILKQHHHFLAETKDVENIPNLGSFFQSLRAFLLQLLPASDKNKFSEENYISFHKFRELLNFRQNKLSPEKCWLVIQNFIKGYELIHKDNYLESIEQYQKIPKKERTVSVAEFKEIRDRVWYWYHQYTQEHNLWDDRDLVRTILYLHCYQPEYTVIFCDEAQDFTRLELQLIMGLSVFSLYDLEQETIFSLPFAFAGDPLQTLNPTGFRWASFQAAFHDEVLTPLRLVEKSQVRLQLQQLKYNYRSAAAIVKVNNLIQLWRKVLFNLNDIEPQKAKKYSSFIPQKFIFGENITLANLQHSLKNTIILIPCDEGAEKEFISQDSLLNSLCIEEDSNNPPWNILSAISAKGLEFKQVILYRFGEACSLNLSNLDRQNFVTTEEDKYFLNKLYVAASRATEKLFIIDSLEGDRRLWIYTSDRKYLNYFLSQLENEEVKQQWQENIDLISLGNSLFALSNNNLEADALTFETAGISTENILLIEKAIAVYTKLQNYLKADFCLAWKLKLQRNFLKAGNIFLRQQKVAEAWTCFWQAKAWLELQQIIINEQYLPDVELNDLKLLLPIINFMATIENKNSAVTTSQIYNLLEITDLLAKELPQYNLRETQNIYPWQEFLTYYCHQITSTFTQSSLVTQANWLKIAAILNNFLAINYQDTKPIIAQCLYFGQNYHQAVLYWEALDEEVTQTNKPKYYYFAQAKLIGFPQGLSYLYQGKQYQTIIHLWLKFNKKLDTAWLEYVSLSLMAIKQYNHALTIYCQLNNLEAVKQCWLKVKQNKPTLQQYKQLTKYYLQHQHWNNAIIFAATELKTLQLKSYFIYCLANSKLKPDTLKKIQRQKYQKFIEQNFFNNSQWQKYLTPEYIGIALEKIGSLITTLNFYEQYINSADQLLQKFSRDRYIVTKQKQIEYFRSQAQITKVKKNQKQLIIQAQKWHLDLNSLSLTIPSITSLISKRTN